MKWYPAETARKPYRFGFVLTTAAGNMTRYLNLRKYAERDTTVECVWAPVSHYWDNGPYEWLPDPIRRRCVNAHQARPVMRQLGRMDAVMFHMFEAYLSACLQSTFRRKPLIVWSQDNPPQAAPDQTPQYGGNHARARWRQQVRLLIDHRCARQTALFFPFCQWGGDVLTQQCHIPVEKVHPINVGLDLELWPALPLTERRTNSRPQILFVGGDFVRKGGDLLLDVYQRRFADIADLHLVTVRPPQDLPPNVKVYTDLQANDPRLRNLYALCDLFVMPTRADMMPWVVLEAMAVGRPVITTRMGGIPDAVKHGETGFLLEPEDSAALAEAMQTLLTHPALCQQMGSAGRAIIEQQFNAEVCVPRILGQMKQAVDAARQNHPQPSESALGLGRWEGIRR